MTRINFISKMMSWGKKDQSWSEKGQVESKAKFVKFVNFVMSKIKSLKISKSHRIFEKVIGYVIQGIGRRMTQLTQLAQL